jgi:hypothetical protein
MQNIEHLSKIYHDSRPIRQSSKSNSPSASHVLAPHGIIQEELMTHRRIYSRSLLKPQHTTHFSFHTPQDFQTQLRVPVLERRFDNCARRTYPRPTLEPHHATIATCSFYTPQDYLYQFSKEVVTIVQYTQIWHHHLPYLPLFTIE